MSICTVKLGQFAKGVRSGPGMTLAKPTNSQTHCLSAWRSFYWIHQAPFCVLRMRYRIGTSDFSIMMNGCIWEYRESGKMSRKTTLGGSNQQNWGPGRAERTRTVRWCGLMPSATPFSSVHFFRQGSCLLPCAFSQVTQMLSELSFHCRKVGWG